MDLPKTIKEIRFNTDAALDRRIKTDIRTACPSTPSIVTSRPQCNIWLRYSIAAVLLLGLFYLGQALFNQEQNGASPPNVVKRQTPDTKMPSGDLVRINLLEQEKAQQGYLSRDIVGLLGLLDTGSSETQARAAHYLGQLGDPSVIPHLEALIDSWPGDPEENPFEAAIEQLSPAEAPVEANKPAAKLLLAPLPDETKGLTFTLTVRDKNTQEPIPDANIMMATHQLGTRRYTGDANGVCHFPLGETIPEQFDMLISKPNYIGLNWQWKKGLHEEGLLLQPYHFELDPGIDIGGVVVDEGGFPIPNVELRVDFWRVDDYSLDPRVRLLYAYQNPLKTDANGYWAGDGPSFMLKSVSGNQCRISTEHPEYASESLELYDGPTMKALSDKSFQLALSKGLVLRGRVINRLGQAIAGAKVSAGSSCFTDPNGLFELSRISPNSTKVYPNVDAEGFCYLRVGYACYPGMPPITIVLDRALHVSGRVVDSQSTPIDDARVSIGSLSAQTNTEGVFDVNGIPERQQSISVTIKKKGFMTQRDSKPIDDLSRDIVLTRALTVTGTVRDAATGLPIERFRIRPCTVSKIQGTRWDNITFKQKEGNYSHTFDDFYDPGFAIIVEAEGYAPTQSRLIHYDEDNAVADFELLPGTAISGSVVNARGIPVSATVYLGIYLGSLRISDGYGELFSIQTRTDDQGQFSLEPTIGIQWLLAVSDHGIKTVLFSEFNRDEPIVLQPWAEIKGQLQIENKPAVNHPVRLYNCQETRTRNGYAAISNAHTDAQGRFGFKRVAPGRYFLFGQPIVVEAGEVLTLDFPGLGRTVTGQLASAVSEESGVWDSCVLEIQEIPPELTWELLPKPEKTMPYSPNELDQWISTAIRDSEGPGPAIDRWGDENRADRRYPVALDQSGGFKAMHVLPGHYALVNTNALATGEVYHVFDIPDITDSVQHQIPLELGHIAGISPSLNIGQPAPDVDVPAYGGGRLRLADYSGQSVLLVFYHPKHQDALGAQLASIAERHPNRAILGMRVTDGSPILACLGHSKHWNWPEGLVYKDSPVCKRYGANRLPWYAEISRQGRISAIGPVDDDLIGRVE